MDFSLNPRAAAHRPGPGPAAEAAAALYDEAARLTQVCETAARAHGTPAVSCAIRAVPEDFRVDEELALAPSGAGEHVWLQIRKRGLNTEWVAGRLAAVAGVSRREVGYAGMKDRLAVATQWFSVRLPGAAEPQWSRVEQDGIEILTRRRHERKLRHAVLRANRFELVLRDLRDDRADLARRVERIGAAGVPNYFGEQRFGHGGGNLTNAARLFAGRLGRCSRHKRALYWSAARAGLFNAVLSQRVTAGNWNRPLPGEALVRALSRGFFVADAVDAELTERVVRHELQPSGTLWGAGAFASRGQAASLETEVATAYPRWCEALEATGLDAARRALRVQPRDLKCWALDAEPTAYGLSFSLPPGSYATSVLRELVNYRVGTLEEGKDVC